MSEEKKDFVIKDRRIFSQDSSAAETKEQEQPAPSSNKIEEETQAQKSAPVDEAQEPLQLPEINFPTFIVSLNASALLHLGAIEDPTTGKKEKNLPMAKQTIDILSMLQQKTASNLTKEEENLMKNLLYELRIMYVKAKG
jgi:hypothetical protein